MGKNKGGGVDLDEVERLAGIQGDIAQSLFDETTPLRQALTGQLGSFLGVPTATAPGAVTVPSGTNVPALGTAEALGLTSIADSQNLIRQARQEGFVRQSLGSDALTFVREGGGGPVIIPVRTDTGFRFVPRDEIQVGGQPGQLVPAAAAAALAGEAVPRGGEGESVLPTPFQPFFGQEPGALPEFAQPFFGDQPGDLPEFAQEFFGEDGQIPPFLLPTFAPIREATEAQFERARENILGTGVRGGQLRERLGDVELARAQAVGAIEAPLRQQLFQQELGLRQQAAQQQLALQQGLFGQELGLTGDLFNVAQGVAFGAPQSALSGLSSAAQNLSNVAQIGAQQQAASGQSLGQLAGLGLKAGLLFGGGAGASPALLPLAGV